MHILKIANKSVLSNFNRPTINNSQGCEYENYAASVVNLDNSPANFIGKFDIAFGQKKKSINSVSRDFSKHCYMPPHKRIPDGFKFFSKDRYTQLIDTQIDARGREYSKVPEQVTVIDRREDKDLQEIISEYKKCAAVWKEEIKKEHQKPSNLKSKLIQRTEFFVNSYKNTNLNKRELADELRALEGNELYIGELFKAGLVQCRHKAFMMKLLLETQGINLGVQYGRYIEMTEPIENSIIGHAWNVFEKNINGKKAVEIVDATRLIPLKNNYLGFSFDRIYDTPESFNSIYRQIESIKPGENLVIGIDKDNRLATCKSGNDFTPLLMLRWGLKDEFVLEKIDEKAKICVDNKKDLPMNLEVEDAVFLRMKDIGRCLLISPKDIRREFYRQLKSSMHKIDLERKTFFDNNYYFDKLCEVNPNLSMASLGIVTSPEFHENWIKHIG